MPDLKTWRMRKLVHLCLAVLLVGCAPQPQAAGPFGEAMSAAKGWQEKQVWPLVESEVRKALAVDKANLEARHLLFLSLSHQGDKPEAIKEAIALATELEAHYPEGSQERRGLVSFREEQAFTESWATLLEAVEKKRPDAEALLDHIPEAKRDEQYWRLAYQVRKDHPNLKLRMDTLRSWLKFDPTGSEAEFALKELQRYDLGLTENPKTSFKHLVKADPAARTSMVQGYKGRLNDFNTVLKHCRVIETTETKGNRLKVLVSFANPYTKKSARETLDLVYTQVGGAYLLNLDQSRFGSALAVLGDPSRVLDSKLTGIHGVFNINDIGSSEPLRKAFGPGKRDDRHQIFDGGRIYAYFDTSYKKLRLLKVDIQHPSYRTVEGLGLGSSIEDFAARYDIEKKRYSIERLGYDEAMSPDRPKVELRLYEIGPHKAGGPDICLGTTAAGVVELISFRTYTASTEEDHDQKP